MTLPSTPNIKAYRPNQVLQEDITRNFIMAVEHVTGKLKPSKSYSETAEMIGLKQGNLSGVLNGSRPLPLEAAVRLCDVFGVSYSFMFGNKGEMFGKDEVMDRLMKLEARVENLEIGAGKPRKK